MRITATAAITISGSSMSIYGSNVISKMRSWTAKSMYQYATAMRIAMANPVSFPCLTLTAERGSVRRVRTKHARESAAFFPSSLL